MSVSAVSSYQPSDMPDSLVPRLPSENATTSVSSGTPHLHMFEADDDSPSFSDLLDVINPLQHIPIINDIYRELTGDKIGVGARLAGGALFGGPIGLIGSAVNAVLEEATGHDVGGHIIAFFKDDEPAASGTALASAQAQAPASGPTALPETAAQPLALDAAKDGGDKTAAAPMLLPDPAETTQLAQAPAALALATPAPTRITPDAARVMADATIPPPPAAAPQAPVAAAEGRQMPLWGGREPRAMPVPARTTPMATKSPPALGMAISNTSGRSNTPVTGARTYQPPMSPALVQEMAATQASTQAGNAASGDWFSGAMIQGLAKYERNSKPAQASGGNVSISQ
ncbi:MAG: hypothetical protein Q7R40_13290 [Phaeospirillum sp.]|nr:hypothetical protein [Phaeospirillum sp.]